MPKRKTSKTIAKKSTKDTKGSTWTEGRLNTFLRSLIRSGFRKYPPKYEVLKEALWGKKLNSKTGRQCYHYTCASCKKQYPSSEVNVDHINAVIDPSTGFENWDVYIKRMFCSKENLQVLCETCHNEKTLQETRSRNESKKQKK